MSTPPRSTFGRRLRALRLTHGMSQVELAQRIGRHQTAIGPYERDEYEPPRDVVEKLAAALDTSPEYLYFGRHPRQTALSVVGRLGRAGLLEPQDEPSAELVVLGDDRLQGYRLLDDSMAPVFRERQLVLVPAVASQKPVQLLGRDVLAELADGRVLLRRLLPAADPTRFDLAAYNASILPSVTLKSARPVVGVLWPEAWSEGSRSRSGSGNTLMVDEKF
ncbi:helix-turn-helix domain-containing protein [Benzoatithermus flavus]|uniref:Helix-turn-helix transcriptional regulator n=1 Tax=Benzoatithermus flavus TaxID=3108223 RepID=A0ABU8XLY8_9PROT